MHLAHYNDNSREFSMRHDRVSGILARASELLLFMIHSLLHIEVSLAGVVEWLPTKES